MKHILTILIVLIIILAILMLIWNKGNSQEEGLLLVMNNTKRIIPFSEIDKLSKSSFTTNRGDAYDGYSLMDVINTGAVIKFKSIILRSQDGGSLKLDEKDDIYSAHFIEMDEFESRSFRLIIPTDEFGQRWMKYITTIEVH